MIILKYSIIQLIPIGSHIAHVTLYAISTYCTIKYLQSIISDVIASFTHVFVIRDVCILHTGYPLILIRANNPEGEVRKLY